MAAWLPPLVCLPDHGGDWNQYIEAVYEFFRHDFVASAPTFHGQRVGIKRHPAIQGKEAAFWHLISEGSAEIDRLPDLRRCERIRWPRPIIESIAAGSTRCWRNSRRGEPRIVIALEDFSYVVILAVRNGYTLLWTAYCVEQGHRRTKLKKEFDAVSNN